MRARNRRDVASRRSRIFAALTLAAAAGLMLAPAAIAADPSAPPKPNTPIEHLVVLMQENHTFDNYFGTYPGADGIPAGVCMPIDPNNPSAGCVRSYHLPSHRTIDLNHGAEVAIVAENNGAYNGFVYAQNRRNLPGETAMGYYDGSDLPFYWNLASEYVLADRFFSSDIGGSRENHMYWVAGQPGDSQSPKKGYTFDTIFDRLEAAGVSWKFYVQNYDPTINYRPQNLTGDAQDSQTIWVPLVNMDRFIDDPHLAGKIVDIGEYRADLAAGTLPAVSFMVPSGASEHPPGDVSIGQVYGASQVTALIQSTSWSKSAFVLTWDDWGGWYDHVIPPKVDSNGYGLRVPALIVSPYSTPGRIDSTTYDFTSILRFIEDNWDLQPLTARDAAANSIAAAFDFSTPPRAPRLPAPVYPAQVEVSPSARLALLGVYGLILIVVPAGGVIAWRRRPPRPSVAAAYASTASAGVPSSDLAGMPTTAGAAVDAAAASVGTPVSSSRMGHVLRTMPITAPPPVPAKPRPATEERRKILPAVPPAAPARVAATGARDEAAAAPATPIRRRVMPTKVVTVGAPSRARPRRAAATKPTEAASAEVAAPGLLPTPAVRRRRGTPATVSPAIPPTTTLRTRTKPKAEAAASPLPKPRRKVASRDATAAPATTRREKGSAAAPKPVESATKVTKRRTTVPPTPTVESATPAAAASAAPVRAAKSRGKGVVALPAPAAAGAAAKPRRTPAALATTTSTAMRGTPRRTKRPVEPPAAEIAAPATATRGRRRPVQPTSPPDAAAPPVDVSPVEASSRPSRRRGAKRISDAGIDAKGASGSYSCPAVLEDSTTRNPNDHPPASKRTRSRARPRPEDPN